MRRKHALAAIALLVAPLSGVASASGAPAAKAQAQVLGNIEIQDDGTATVTARYICPSGFHLWVSAKQVEDGNPDRRLREEGSSEISSAWWQSHPTDFTCDGRWRTDEFEINTEFDEILGGSGFGQLKSGQAWVQFCLIGDGVFISEARWVRAA